MIRLPGSRRAGLHPGEGWLVPGLAGDGPAVAGVSSATSNAGPGPAMPVVWGDTLASAPSNANAPPVIEGAPLQHQLGCIRFGLAPIPFVK